MKTSRLFSPRAFTLVEVLFALTISGFALAAVMTLFLYVSLNNYIGEQRLGANDDVRYFTAQMIADARASNIVRVYQAFYPYTTVNNQYPFTGTTQGGVTYNGSTFTNNSSTSVTPFTVDNPLDSNDQVATGRTGDYLVMVSYSDPFIGPPVYNGTGNVPAMYVNRLILYWVAPNVNFPGEYAIYRFDSNNLAAGAALPWAGGVVLGSGTSVISATTSLESLLPTPPGSWPAAGYSWAQVVVNDVRGLATDSLLGNSIGQIFINFQSTSKANASVLMHALILHGNASKRLTDTYNFTITPGG